jgi:hypothetical protein
VFNCAFSGMYNIHEMRSKRAPLSPKSIFPSVFAERIVRSPSMRRRAQSSCNYRAPQPNVHRICLTGEYFGLVCSTSEGCKGKSVVDFCFIIIKLLQSLQLFSHLRAAFPLINKTVLEFTFAIKIAPRNVLSAVPMHYFWIKE